MPTVTGPKVSLFRTAKELLDEENQAPNSSMVPAGSSQPKVSRPVLNAVEAVPTG
jgi:hypothetical protein